MIYNVTIFFFMSVIYIYISSNYRSSTVKMIVRILSAFLELRFLFIEQRVNGLCYVLMIIHFLLYLFGPQYRYG